MEVSQKYEVVLLNRFPTILLLSIIVCMNVAFAESKFRVDEYCDLDNAKTQCREKFKDFLKKNGCSYESQPIVCDLESQIKKLGHVPEKFTCAYASPNCYTVQNSRSYLCESGFTSTSIPGNNDIKLCANRRDSQGIEPESKGGVR